MPGASLPKNFPLCFYHKRIIDAGAMPSVKDCSPMMISGSGVLELFWVVQLKSWMDDFAYALTLVISRSSSHAWYRRGLGSPIDTNCLLLSKLP